MIHEVHICKQYTYVGINVLHNSPRGTLCR